MDQALKKKLQDDPNGLMTYEYIANHMGQVDDIMSELVENIIDVDRSGQFVVSTARYLHAIDREKYAQDIDMLIKAAITKDRDRAYLPDLAATIWGNDYQGRAQELSATDDNFRRIYKRLYPNGI
jgi:hypothetical protein